MPQEETIDRRRNVDITKELSIDKDIAEAVQIHNRLTYFGKFDSYDTR